MTEALFSWIRGIFCAALLCAAALALCPKGRVKTVLSAVCGAIMLCAVIMPISDFDYTLYSQSLAEYRKSAAEFSEEGEEYAQGLNRTYIQEKCAAYIVDKAASLGADISASVLAEWSEAGYFYPVSAVLEGELNDIQRARLSAYIESELGISADMQEWTGAENSDEQGD